MTTTNCKDCGKALTADEAHYYGATCEECEGKAFHASQDLDPAHQAEPPCPYYITGPDIAKGAYAVAEVATGRIVARIPAEQAPSLTVGEWAALVPVETLDAWKSMANSLAVLSLKSERARVAFALKQLIQAEIDDAQPAAQAEPVALRVVKGDVCYRSSADDQSHGMWLPIDRQADHGFDNGTLFYTAPQTKPAAQGVEDARDAARWRAVANVFHITDQVGERTGQHAVKLSTHWAAWVDGKHASVTDAVDAYAAAMAAKKEQQ